jgi:OmpA-OmpF porin, OOP family
MDKYHYKTLFFLILMAGTLLIGCAGEKVMMSAPAFKPYQFDADQYVPKVDNFMVILDTSSSMAYKYRGQTKDTTAKEFLMAMNETLPELKYNGALRTFGHGASLPDRSTMLLYGVKSYSTAAFGQAINDVKEPGGSTSLPLAKAIAATGKDLASAQGPIAMVIVSDGIDFDQAPITAAETLKSQFGDRLCIDTVLIGDDPAGKLNLEQVAKAGGCGMSATADELASSENMKGFVERIFLAKSAPKPAPMAVAPTPKDSDKDGVPDNLDQCPNTPLGATVDARGCWAFASAVLFDLNSAEVKSDAYPTLNDAVYILKKNPDLKIRIDGYTDSTGTKAYNKVLSERRAKAVEDFFISRGVDPQQLTIKGFGVSNPVASNKTKEGRAKNRRVELTPVK